MDDEEVKNLQKAAEREVVEMCNELLVQLEQLEDVLLRLLR